MTKTGNKNGMNWIKPHKRLAIYLRDGLACVYCSAGVETGVVLTLDHLVPRIKGGSNKSSNLATACMGCNSSRGQLPWRSFVEESQLVPWEDEHRKVIRHITNLVRRKVDSASAKRLIESRGGFTPALLSLRTREYPFV